MPYDISEEELSNRFDRLLKLDEKIRTENNLARLGKVYEVLVEEETAPGNLASRTEGNLLVHFSGDKTLIGTFQNVKIIDKKGYYLTGELVK